MRPLLGSIALLIALPLAAQPVRPTEAYLPQFSRTVKPAVRAQVALSVDWPRGTTLRSCGVTFGVPFPRGALASVQRVRLLEDGREIPATITRTATWDRPDGDVKWLLVDARVRRGAQYALEYGTQVRPLPASDGIRVEASADGVTVTNGPLRFSVSRATPSLLAAAWLDRNGDGKFADSTGLPEGERVTPLTPSPPPYMVDDEGKTYSLSTGEGFAVTVEQPGPLHAIVKVEGWYRDANGAPFCQGLTRLHTYAGESFIRVEHTFVIGFDTDRKRIKDIALPLALAIGGQTRATFGLEGTASRQVPGPAYLLQDSDEHFSLKGGDGAELVSGRRAAGWVDVSGPVAGVTVGLRHVWQECPKELEVKDGAITAHLWPPHHSKPLDFDAKAVLGPERYQEWNQVFWAEFYKDGLDQYDQAYGLAKSNDLILAFHAPRTEPAADICATLEHPVIVSASPDWMCRSDVMGLLHPRAPQRFPEEERRLAAAFGRFRNVREHCRNYGMIDYGDVDHQVVWDATAKRWVSQPWRRWASRFYGHPLTYWVDFLRTGDREYLEWGQDNARHVMDIDMCHLTAEKIGDYKYPKQRGGRYGGNGGIIHYGADMYDLGCDSHVDHLLLQYYLTGYRRAWDVLQEEGEFYLWKGTFNWGTLGGGWGHRMTGGALRIMTTLYQTTWSETYLKHARRMAQLCYENQDAEGVIRFDDVYMAPGLFGYYQATGDERMKDLFLRCMRKQAQVGRLESDPRSFSYYGPSMAYSITGDPTYLGWSERWRRDFVDCVNVGDDPLQYGNPRGEWDYCYLTLHQVYLPYYLEALATLSKPVPAVIRDNAITSGDIILCRKNDQPFNVVAEWFCYDPTRGAGVPFAQLGKYVARNPVQPRVVLREPNGAEVVAGPVAIAPVRSSQSDLAATISSGKVALNVPGGPTGIYRLGIETPGTLHLKLRLASCDLTKWGYATEGDYLACADGYYFHVGPQVEQFSLSFKTLALRLPMTFAVYDSEGEEQKREESDYGAEPQAEYKTWSFATRPAQRGKLWRFSVSPSSPQVEQTYLKFSNVPPIVWTNPEAFFPTDQAAVKPRQWPPAVAAPYEAAAGALRIEAGRPLSIPRGEARGEGRYKNLDARQGTLEFWFRPQWARDDIRDHTMARCGQLRLYRRSRLGTYLSLGGVRQSGFVTEPGQWVHLALTWDAGAAGREPKTQLFINGVEASGMVLSAARDPLGDWTGDTLTIGGDGACTIDDLRVSDVVRYTGDFDPPKSAPADEHVLLRETY